MTHTATTPETFPSTGKIWFDSYPQGVPYTINPDQYQSLIEVFTESCDRYLHREAYSSFGSRITYQQLRQSAQHFASYCQHVLKLKPGDRIALMMPNCLQYPICMFGALMAGLIVVNINPLYTATELAHQLNDSGASTIVVITNTAYVLQQALSKVNLQHIIVTKLGDLLPAPKSWVVNFAVKYIRRLVHPFNLPKAIKLKTVLEEGATQSYQPIKINNQDVAFLQYTGGTTGLAKGAMLTHRNLIANILQAEAWLFKGDSKDKSYHIIITALPLYHIFSLLANCLCFIKFGGLNVLITDPRDLKNFVRQIKPIPFTAITGVNTLFNALVNYPPFSQLNFSSLELSLAGGMSVQRSVAERWHALTGKPIIEGFGMTECSPIATISSPDQISFTGSIGLPLSSTELSVRDADGKEVAIGEIGELCIKGPQVMKGYWNSPEETEAVLKDGWLYSGDMACMDEKGYFKIVDRKKDMIIVSGFNVYPNEVEDIIAHHPKVLEVAVIGVPAKHSGEMVKAVIVKKCQTLTEDEIKTYCYEHLTRYKVPKIIEFREALPKSNVGKILRRALR